MRPRIVDCTPSDWTGERVGQINSGCSSVPPGRWRSVGRKDRCSACALMQCHDDQASADERAGEDKDEGDWGGDGEVLSRSES